jgi:REP element-mobilizing transposase RayT
VPHANSHLKRRRRVAKLAQRESAGLVSLECGALEARHLSYTYFQNVMHVVFSTKERRKTIPTLMKERLWAYTAGICRHQNIFAHAIGGMEDHIHLLLQFPPTLMIAGAILDIKANSSGWMSHERDRQVCVATGLWRFWGEQIEYCSGGAIHPKSGTAP